ncbi:MAG: hypothetical protein VYC39_10760 [Myxococcota bacterium]|nr:hypothetical protein [Myxococcota bacterium]
MMNNRLFQTIIILNCAWAVCGCGQTQEVQRLQKNRQQKNKQPLVCSTLDRETCHAAEECIAAYEDIDCIQGPCPEVGFVRCFDEPTPPAACVPVTCEIACAFGFATDANGCEFCACLPPIGSCEQMDEYQCNSAGNCQAHYLPQVRPNSSGASDSRGRHPKPPCRDSDPDCNPDPEPNPAPAPHPQNFVGCTDRIKITECASDSDCPGGYCQILDQDDAHEPVPAPSSQPRTESGFCEDLPCTDGSVLVCETPQPLCERGSIATIRDECWACIPAESCAEEVCTESRNETRAYISRDKMICNQLGSDLNCDDGSKFFSDACGCGCEIEDPFYCPPESEEVNYISEDPTECEMLDFECSDGNVAFLNECGCGCSAKDEPITPPSTTKIIDCGEGIEPSCDALPGQCPAGRILTIRNGCWDCISETEC